MNYVIRAGDGRWFVVVPRPDWPKFGLYRRNGYRTEWRANRAKQILDSFDPYGKD